MTLLAFAADRRAAVDMDWKAAAAIDWYKLPTGPTVANPPHAVAAGECTRQTERRTPYRYIDPAAYYATSVNN